MNLLTSVLIECHTHLNRVLHEIEKMICPGITTAHPLERLVAALGAELLVHQRCGPEAAITPQDPGLGLSGEI